MSAGNQLLDEFLSVAVELENSNSSDNSHFLESSISILYPDKSSVEVLGARCEVGEKLYDLEWNGGEFLTEK